MNETEMLLRVMQEFNCNKQLAELLIKSAEMNNSIDSLTMLVKKGEKQ